MTFKTSGFIAPILCTMSLSFGSYELKADVITILPGSAITLNPTGEVTVQCSKATTTTPSTNCIPCIYDENQVTENNDVFFVRYCYKAESSRSQPEKVCGRWARGDYASTNAAYSQAKTYCENYLREDPRCK